MMKRLRQLGNSRFTLACDRVVLAAHENSRHTQLRAEERPPKNVRKKAKARRKVRIKVKSKEEEKKICYKVFS